jgi:hypothetical protein
MADPTLDATVGGAASNSYVTRAGAQLYMDTRTDVSAWTAAADADKDRALIMATYRLEQEEYLGAIRSYDQALKWPRGGLTDEDGRLYDPDAIPAPIQRACTALALAILAGGVTLADSGLEAFINVQVGSLNVTPRAARVAGTLPADVQRFLRGLWVSTSGLSRPVWRA